MSELVPTQAPAGSGRSPFDAIRRTDERGEYWSARELMKPLGYDQWRRFEDAVERAKASAEAAGHSAADHIAGAGNMVGIGSGAKRTVKDFRLTRYGCYLVAMNGDPRKPEVAAAQTYFAVQTHRAEQSAPLAGRDELTAGVLELQHRSAALLAEFHRRQAAVEVRANEAWDKADNAEATADHALTVATAKRTRSRRPNLTDQYRRVKTILCSRDAVQAVREAASQLGGFERALGVAAAVSHGMAGLVISDMG
jgi:DNA-damage-inducible protein D